MSINRYNSRDGCFVAVPVVNSDRPDILPAGIADLADERAKRQEARRQRIREVGLIYLMAGGSDASVDGICKTVLAVVGPCPMGELESALNDALDDFAREKNAIWERFGVADWRWEDDHVVAVG